MRPLRLRTVGSLLPSHTASFYRDAASATYRAWRSLSTTAHNSHENATTNYTAPPLEQQPSASPLASPVTSHSMLFSRIDSAVLCPRLSQRQMRQRQRKWGALWRYRSEYWSPRSVPTPPQVASAMITASPRTSVRVPHSGVSQDGLAKTTKRGAEQVPPVISSSPSPRRDRTTAEVECETDGGTRASPRADSTGAAIVDSATPGSMHSSAVGTHSIEDPLLTFLDTHEEDAALLLAMWTSLHRSCVFGSALSESIVLQVRYFLHSLLRYRAVGAAVNFYYRLMGIGMQLHQSDLLLLFSSLTYDSPGPTEERQLRKPAKTAVIEDDKKIGTRRRNQLHEPTTRVHPADSSDQSQHNKAGKGSGEALACQMGSMGTVARKTGAPAFCKEGPAGVSAGATESTGDTAWNAHVAGATHIAEGSNVGVSCASRWDRRRADSEAQPPSSIARRVAFHQQPEWIKRWILYEASMGTLEDLDGVEDDGQPSTRSTRSSEDPCWSANNRVHMDTAAPSWQPLQRIEMEAILEHLHLLTLGAMQRDHRSPTEPNTTLPRLPLRCSSRRPQPRSVEKLYWKEALELVRGAYISASWPIGLSKGDGNLPCQAAEGLALPTGVAFALQSMLREVQSWKGALALLRLTLQEANHRGAGTAGALSMTPDCFLRGSILFMALAAPAQPWKTQALVEEWMHRVMLPRLAHDARAKAEAPFTATAATAALHALWLSHLCSVKASRPDEFVALSEEAADYLTSSSALRAIRGDLTLMMTEVCSSTELALDALRQTVLQALQYHRASEVLAKSIRTGAYRVENAKGMPELNRDHKSNHAVDALTKTAVTSSAALMCGMSFSPSSQTAIQSSPSLSTPLLSDMMDVFALCCAAVKETVWLRLTTAASTNYAATMVEVLQFLERSVHGPAGLLSVFQLLCGPPVSRQAHNDKESPLVSTAYTTSGPERAYMSCLLATTLLQLVQLLCAPPDPTQRRFGSQVWNGAVLVLLVEFAVKVLERVTAEHVQQAPWRWAIEGRQQELANATASTIRLVVRQLDINCMNERVMFGAMADQDVELCALLVRVFNKSSELMVASRASDVWRISSPSPVWQILTSTCSPRTLQGIHLCLSSSSALGKRVRYRLSRRDVDNLDRWIQPPRSRLRTSARLRCARGEALSLSTRVMKVGVGTGVAVRERDVGIDFSLTRSLRDSLYTILNSERTKADVGQALQRLASTMSGCNACWLLCHLVTKDIALARGTCTVDFFATTLDRMAQEVAKSSATAPAVTRVSLLQGGRLRPSRETYGTQTAPKTYGPPNLWLRALDVFWSAVDHAEHVEVAATQHPSASTVNAAETARTWSLVSVESQERAVLARLLLPLLRFSRAVNRPEVGRQWRRTWIAMYAPQEKKNPQWRQQNIEALSLLGEAAALTRCVAEYHDCGSEALLCSVALQHSDWHSALEALFQTYGAIEERHATGTTYSCDVARTILSLLTKSPMNLSNTAMRVRTVQGEMWDVECSLAVVRLLLRGRRWRLALTHVDEALELPDMQRVKAQVLVDPAGHLRQEAFPTSPTQTILTHYTQLLTAALQATAIGGDSERASVYYDAFKALLRYVFADTVNVGTLHAAEDCSQNSDSDGLDAALDMATLSERGEAHASCVEDRVQQTVRELAPRARILFFRAMTKRMLTSHAGK
ncbi:hypothetical protein Q4I30_007872 [Leishmania utingensis]|uniref:Uncharacterized protein n=1 Tax=Leishmania utingensis TaxID=653362 RepID=A0AAW2ZTS5_9TRYP